MTKDIFRNLKFEETLNKIREYMKEYHPAGYGTRVISLHLSVDGWVLIMERFDNCD